MSYAQSIDGLNIEVTTGKLAQSIDSLDMLLSTSEGTLQDGIVLISPANGDINVSITPSFDWSSSTAYGAYKILIDADQTFSSPIEAYVTASDYAQTTALLSATGYFWKVIGGNVTDQPAIVPDDGFVGMTVWDSNTDPAPIYYPNDIYPQSGNTPDGVAPLVKEAAEDLSNYIAQSSGKTAPDVTGVASDFNFPTRCIKVGFTNPALTEREEIQIKCDGNVLNLTGKDVFDPDNPDWVGDATEQNYMLQAGSYYAVMTFLHKYVGIVWGWAGPLGEAVPSNSELKLDAEDYTHSPSCITREFMRYSMAGGDTTGYGLSKTFMKRHRHFWSLRFDTGHEMNDIYERFHPDVNPDLTDDWMFALQPDGTRSGWPSKPQENLKYAKVEVGDPAFDDFYIENYVQFGLNNNPLRRAFSTAFNDASASGHSRDPRALAMDYTGVDAVDFDFKYRTGTITAPTSTDREVKFCNRVFSKMRENPGYSDIVMMTNAYGPTRIPPKETVPDPDGVYIAGAFNEFTNPEEPGEGGSTHRENFDQYLSVAPYNHLWRCNLGTGYGHPSGYFFNPIQRLGARFKDLIDNGVTGFLPDTLWEHHSTQWPVYYLMSQLSWDHTQNVNNLMDKAYNTLFGDAAAHVKAYYEYSEDIINVDYETVSNPISLSKRWNDSVLQNLQDHLTSAFNSVNVGSIEYERLEWLQAGLQWCKDVTQSCQFWVLYNSPGIITDPTLIDPKPNAIESDVDATTGWGNLYGYSPLTFSSVEDGTDGNNFMFFLDGNTPDTGIEKGLNRDDPLPGTSSDLYVVTFEAKHSGNGTDWYFDRSGTGEERRYIRTEDTEWMSISTEAYGGEILRFRSTNEGYGSIYVRRLKIQAAEPVDKPALIDTWDAHNQASVDRVKQPQWEYADNDYYPIGKAVLRLPTGRMPDFETEGPIVTDPGLI